MHPTIRAYLTAGFKTREQMLEHARLRGEASYRHVLGALTESDLKESAGNIVRLLKIDPKAAEKIHSLFGPLDFPAAKLMMSLDPYDDGPVAVDPNDLKSVNDQVEQNLDWLIEELVGRVVELIGAASPGEYIDPGDLKSFLQRNQAIIAKINTTPVGAACIEIARQAALMKKRALDKLKVIVPLADGWNWVDLGSCVDGPEGIEMQHCGQDGRGNLVSLRDPHNNPHVTMTYNAGDNAVYQIKGKQNTVPVRKYWPYIVQFFQKTGAKLDDWWLESAANEPPGGDDFDHAPELMQQLAPFRKKKLPVHEGAPTRQNSIAMVVVPGEPPGKNVCGFIRGLVGNRTRVIVAAQPGSLSPGQFERLLRASMPDCEKKLRIMDVGDSIADAVSSAERNRHYSPSQALEVYADPQLARNFSQEVSDGRLDFDPTVIRAIPTEIPTDDMKGILAAVQDDDVDAMHRVLDPHLFSDANSLQQYKDVIKGGQLPSNVEVVGSSSDFRRKKESMVREFLTDIAPSRELGIQKLDAILRAELGDHFADLEYLGSGRNGSAYRTPDGLIVKVTTDPVEAESAAVLVGRQCEYIHRVHVVNQIDENIWVILQEGGLEKLPPQYCEEFDLAMEIIETIGAGKALREGDAEGVKEIMVRSGHRDLCMLVAEVMRKFDVGGMLREVRELGLSADFHSGNIMLREGRPVLTDLGTPGDDPGEQKGPPDGDMQVHEAGVQAAPQAGPRSQMRGSNSSAWAGGRLVLSKPEQHVPEDENATEDDFRLDQDIVGGGLDWGRGLVGRGY
jgi:hypothetical protein